MVRSGCYVRDWFGKGRRSAVRRSGRGRCLVRRGVKRSSSSVPEDTIRLLSLAAKRALPLHRTGEVGAGSYYSCVDRLYDEGNVRGHRRITRRHCKRETRRGGEDTRKTLPRGVYKISPKRESGTPLVMVIIAHAAVARHHPDNAGIRNDVVKRKVKRRLVGDATYRYCNVQLNGTP